MNATYWLVTVGLIAISFGLILAGGGSKRSPLCWVGAAVFLVAMLQAISGAVSSLIKI